MSSPGQGSVAKPSASTSATQRSCSRFPGAGGPPRWPQTPALACCPAIHPALAPSIHPPVPVCQLGWAAGSLRGQQTTTTPARRGPRAPSSSCPGLPWPLSPRPGLARPLVPRAVNISATPPKTGFRSHARHHTSPSSLPLFPTRDHRPPPPARRPPSPACPNILLPSSVPHRRSSIATPRPRAHREHHRRRSNSPRDALAVPPDDPSQSVSLNRGEAPGRSARARNAAP